jgi:hypothetical protein
LPVSEWQPSGTELCPELNLLEDCSCLLALQRCDCFSVVGGAVAVFIRVAIIAWWRDGVERQIFAARELWLLNIQK